MKYSVKRVVVGPIETNCYIVVCLGTGKGFIIDPGDDFEKIKTEIPTEADIEFIINTHGHIDHIKEDARFNLQVCIHPLDRDCLADPAKNLSIIFETPVSMEIPCVKTVNDGDTISAGQLSLKVIHTPGHSAGSICLKADQIVFTGDTLFCDGYGRTDLPGGSEEVIFSSIRERLLILPDETLIYPGHGPASSIGREKNNF